MYYCDAKILLGGVPYISVFPPFSIVDARNPFSLF